MSDVILSKEEAEKLKALCLTGAAMLEVSKVRNAQLEEALDDIREALDSRYGPDSWTIDRILRGVHK